MSSRAKRKYHLSETELKPSVEKPPISFLISFEAGINQTPNLSCPILDHSIPFSISVHIRIFCRTIFYLFGLSTCRVEN